MNKTNSVLYFVLLSVISLPVIAPVSVPFAESVAMIPGVPYTCDGSFKIDNADRLRGVCQPLASSPSVFTGVQLAWFYKPPAPSLFPTLRDNFDVFVLTHKDEAQRDQLRAMGVTAPIYQYLLLTEIRNPGSCTAIPQGNQIAWKPGDFCWVRTNHPEWILKDTQGREIGGGTVKWLDPANPEFRQWWLEQWEELAGEFDWNELFIDNAQVGIGKFESLNQIPVKYQTHKSYTDAVIGFLQFLSANSDREIIANITNTQDYDGEWARVLATIDGAMVENFAAGWLGATKTRAQWEEQMTAIELANSQGKTLILVSQGEQNDLNRQKFSFASYLLIANENNYFRYAKSGAYNQIWLYENYQVNLGQATSARFREGNNWRRNFERGYVLVNPTTRSVQIVIQ